MGTAFCRFDKRIARNHTPGMRKFVFFLVGLNVLMAVIVTYGAITVQSDAAGRGMAQGFAMVIDLAVLIFALPALIMALAERWYLAAILLAIIPLFGAAILLG